ncbi:MAG: hypothetical protein AB4352_14800 [Hormoscilla sp.]
MVKKKIDAVSGLTVAGLPRRGPADPTTNDTSNCTPSLFSAQKAIAHDRMYEQQMNLVSSKMSGIFQAIGLLCGTIISEDGHRYIYIGDDQAYWLGCESDHNEHWSELDPFVETDTEVMLIVNPFCQHYPRDPNYDLYFRPVAIEPGPGSEVTYNGMVLNDREFVLQGIWQFIPVCRQPCISVFRNFSEDELQKYKKMNSFERVAFAKAQHLPVQWRDAPVPPFRFNPKKDKEEQIERYFVQFKGVLIPERDIFRFESLQDMPTLEIPDHFKANKEDKANVLAAKSRRT